MTAFSDSLGESARAVTDTIDRMLPLDDRQESRLIDAMRYATLGAGKRIRPFIVLTGARLFNVAESCALRVAAAVEMVHCYSLVHDDLPAMDNDDLRRGQPSCHVKFGEATAILAGDALLTRAFVVLADEATHSDPAVRCELVTALGRAIGVAGMVGGQMLDLMAENRTFDMPEVTRLQRLKTGMMFEYACEAGAILGKAPKPVRQSLRAYAHDLGLAFQIADDLLDAEGDEKVVGKKTHKDEAAGKATFVSLMGVDRARAQAMMLSDQAVKHLEIFAEKAESLRELARFVVERRA